MWKRRRFRYIIESSLLTHITVFSHHLKTKIKYFCFVPAYRQNLFQTKWSQNIFPLFVTLNLCTTPQLAFDELENSRTCEPKIPGGIFEAFLGEIFQCISDMIFRRFPKQFWKDFCKRIPKGVSKGIAERIPWRIFNINREVIPKASSEGIH